MCRVAYKPGFSFKPIIKNVCDVLRAYFNLQIEVINIDADECLTIVLPTGILENRFV